MTTAPACTVSACPLRVHASAAGVGIGAAIEAPSLRDEPAYASLVAREFSSITPENELKWTRVQPERGGFAFGDADSVVDFAQRHGQSVRGHTLVWGQAAGNGVPIWVRSITDPADMEQVLTTHIDTVVGRYRGRVDRWDVVNEPLAAYGTELDDNPFQRLLGRRHIDLAFERAHSADPAARLYLTEIGTEYLPAKADALVALVADLRARGVPIHGVGLQGHFLFGAADLTRFGELIARLRALGVEVAITELDIPTDPWVGRGEQEQAEQYAAVVRTCRARGCREVTTWGVHDGDTWLDKLLGRKAYPLLFDEQLRPKPAYYSVSDALR